MNFKKWYKKQSIIGEIDPEMVEDSWNACKREVLKILSKNKVSVLRDDEFLDDHEDPTPTIYIDLDVIGEIEKL
jgi:hypothetical protein